MTWTGLTGLWNEAKLANFSSRLAVEAQKTASLLESGSALPMAKRYLEHGAKNGRFYNTSHRPKIRINCTDDASLKGLAHYALLF